MSKSTMEILRTASLVHVRDGLLASQLDAELVKIHTDCQQRPKLAKARKVTLTITITPIGDDDTLDAVDVEFGVTSSLPATKMQRPMKSMGKRNGFGFDVDTDSIDHSPMQQRLNGIDDADGDEA